MEYFAYGSNLDQEQMKKRCPSAHLVGKALLKDYKLAFTHFSPRRQGGAADIIQSKGGSVWGLLYDMPESDLKRLDTYEGFPRRYRRIEVAVFDEDRTTHTAQAYEVVSKRHQHVPPTNSYIKKMIDAAEKFSFPVDYITHLKNTTLNY